MDVNSVKQGIPGFLDRLYRESVAKIVSQVLLDADFVEDVRLAESLEDFVSYLSAKKKRSIVETLFYLAPKEEQKNIWVLIRGEK